MYAMNNLFRKYSNKKTGSYGGCDILERKVLSIMGTTRHMNPDIIASSAKGMTMTGKYYCFGFAFAKLSFTKHMSLV